jgi:hypothetical protein
VACYSRSLHTGAFMRAGPGIIECWINYREAANCCACGHAPDCMVASRGRFSATQMREKLVYRVMRLLVPIKIAVPSMGDGRAR